MADFKVLATRTFPNPRRDINPIPTLIGIAYRTAWKPIRYDVFHVDEDWRSLLAVIVRRDERIFRSIPHTLTL